MTSYIVDDKGRVEVDLRHNYSSRCRCMSCLSFFLAHQEGIVEVLSQDGKTKLSPPKKTATIWGK